MRKQRYGSMQKGAAVTKACHELPRMRPMDRRQFLAAGGLAAATPVFSHAAGTGAWAHSAAALPGHIDFTSDGLGLGPAEYASALREVATSPSFTLCWSNHTAWISGMTSARFP